MKEMSVVIPTYNRKQMLKECLFSLFDQDYDKQKYEIIVVDDGSMDGTEEMIENLIKTSMVDLIYLRQKHSGQAQARNLGVENSHSPIIAFTDDDCIVDKTWIRNVVGRFNGSNKIDACAGEILGDPEFGYIKIDSEGFFSDISSPSCPGTGNFAIRKTIFLSIGGFGIKLYAIDDKDLFIRLLKAGYKIYVEDAIMVYHRPIRKIKDVFKKNYQYGLEEPVVFKKNFKDRFIFKIGDSVIWGSKFYQPVYINLDLFNFLVTTPFYWLSLKNKSVFMVARAYASSLGRILGNVMGSIVNKVIFYGP